MRHSEVILMENPKRRGRRRSRNPAAAIAMPKTVRSFFQGIKPVDAGSALGGFALATWLPGAVVKDAATTGKKVLKLVVALGSAGMAGMAAKSIGGMDSARAAVAGGMAGALAQAMASFMGVQIGKSAMASRPSPKTHTTQLGLGRYPASTTETPFEKARLQ